MEEISDLSLEELREAYLQRVNESQLAARMFYSLVGVDRIHVC